MESMAHQAPLEPLDRRVSKAPLEALAQQVPPVPKAWRVWGAKV